MLAKPLRICLTRVDDGDLLKQSALHSAIELRFHAGLPLATLGSLVMNGRPGRVGEFEDML